MHLVMTAQDWREAVKRHEVQQIRRDKRSAASRKGWRTRKAMAKARKKS
jgi:hypothetical protein